MIKAHIIVNGRNGRMGREIINLLSRSIDAKLHSGTALAKIKPTKLAVAIDFSSAQGLRSVAAWCVKKNVPLVSGTTGLSDKDMKILKKASKKIPILWSPNMSPGINIILHMIDIIGAKANSYDIQIEEFHHTQKKDSPSGTAKMLQKAFIKNTNKVLPPILSGRGGGIVGNHKIWFMADQEIFTIEHTALNRSIFAKGAIIAATWLRRQPPGFYEFRDIFDE
ncbi:MAG: 4-hydroxy-tetrahydrodipicolinate reductase [Bdellovibrionales bacterium RBG_16_40_8]|nr:MAG: 4-hydroxy-tetrahydrodipicolinate reductase [Bdellovibrionales bacterium RBG_16_40_8]